MKTMDSITYKCPNCDGGLEFDPKSQKFKCGYCLSEFTQEELLALTPEHSQAEQRAEEPAAEAEALAGEAAPEHGAQAEQDPGEAQMLIYSCPSCGAELVTDETTAATFCYYCHNPVVLSGKLEGRYRPDCVLPFEMDRKKAEEIFKTWIGRKKYVPKDFYSPRQMELLEGIYYPYWLYNCELDGRIRADATKLKVWNTGAVEYTETSRFQVERQGTMKVENVIRNALKKADHRLSEGVMPFDFAKAKEFQTGYLSGFKAERRDLEKEEYEQEVQQEISEFAVNELRNSLTGYHTVNVADHEEKLLSSKWQYALMPVWVLTYKDKKDGKLYYFAMNGQSGKVCGVLPVDYKRLAVLFATVFFPILLLLLIGGYFI